MRGDGGIKRIGFSVKLIGEATPHKIKRDENKN